MSSEELSSYVDHGDLLEALRELTGKADVDIEDGVVVCRATKGIEGFLSLVLRVRVPYRCRDGSKQEASIIAKCMPKMGPQHDMVKTTRAFPREGTFFHEVFPLIRRASGGRVPLPMPIAYHSRYGGDDDAIFMEDLGASGFQTPAKSYLANGLDIEHCRLVMGAYGRLHALTIAAEKFLPGHKTTWVEAFPELAKDPLTTSPGPNGSPVPFTEMVEQSVETVLEIAKGLDGLPKEAEASGKLRNVLGGTWNLMRKLVEPKPGDPRVLTHGDCWMNNSMFRYENIGGVSNPVEIKLLDFQMVRYCHPCIDLIHIFYLNTRKSFRTKYMDSLIGLYHECLTKSLKDMNYGGPPITLEKLLKDIHGVYEGIGFVCEAMFLPVMLLGEEFIPSNAEDFTPEKFSDFVKKGNSPSVRNRYASDPMYRKNLDEIIREFVGNIFPNGIHSPISPLFSP